MVGGEVQEKLFKHSAVGLLVLSLLVFFTWGVGSVLGGALRYPLSSFQGLVFIYVVLASAVAFTFLVVYVAYIFKKTSPALRISLVFFILVALCLNGFVMMLN